MTRRDLEIDTGVEPIRCFPSVQLVDLEVLDHLVYVSALALLIIDLTAFNCAATRWIQVVRISAMQCQC